MFRRCFIVWLLLSPAALAEQALDSLVVQTTAGPVRGVRQQGVQVFRGIPYAAAPVGERRWRPPLPAPSWNEVRSCLRFGPSCLQPEQKLLPGVKGEQSEDCLYLNVWAPSAGPTQKRPVLVWIHGGGFVIGSGGQRVYDGLEFARSGLVVVSMNYRLGPFGFLAHPDLSAESPQRVSGNLGLLDQIAALQWVQQNIARFGGDPSRVTIAGESAGSLSVGCLLNSPLAEGLFHRAVMQSGAPGLRTQLPEGEAQGVEIFERLGDSPVRLRNLPGVQVLEAARPRIGLLGKGARMWPLVDGWVIPEPPEERMARGAHHKVPVMLGTNADEGTLFIRQLSSRRPGLYRLFLQRLFGADSDRVFMAFPAASEDEVAPAMARFIKIAAFLAPTRRSARLLSHHGPVYMYHFTRVAPGLRRSGLGATHGAEVLYLFKTLPRSVESKDQQVAQAMHDAWVRFAASGNPNGGELPDWPLYREDDESYMEFGDVFKVGRDLEKEACDLIDTTPPVLLR